MILGTLPCQSSPILCGVLLYMWFGGVMVHDAHSELPENSMLARVECKLIVPY